MELRRFQGRALLHGRLCHRQGHTACHRLVPTDFDRLVPMVLSTVRLMPVHTAECLLHRPMMAQFSTASKVGTENRVDGGAKRRTVRRLLVHTAAIGAAIYGRSKEIREHES